jgi:endo-1,4-beta-xylanase
MMSASQSKTTQNRDSRIIDTRLQQVLNFPLGAATDMRSLKKYPALLDILRKEFTSLTTENNLKMQPVHPNENSYYWASADSLMQIGAASKKRIHGHTLCWHQQVPDWLQNFKGNEQQWEGLLKLHVQTVASHYKGKIASWDVVNEAFNDDGSLRETIFQKNISDYIAKCFRWAREADPKALLFYNDFGQEYAPKKMEAIIKMVKDFKSRGVPIDGVGLQMHTNLNSSNEQIRSVLEAAAKTGLQVHISELDVSVNPRNDSSIVYNNYLQLQQAAKYSFIFKTYNDIVPAAQKYGITLWNLTDADSWIPRYYKRRDWPTLIGEDFKTKQVYDLLLNSIR